jgi:hypothetical protein
VCCELPRSAHPTGEIVRKIGYLRGLVGLLICGLLVRFQRGSPLNSPGCSISCGCETVNPKRKSNQNQTAAAPDDLVAHGSFTWHTDPARFTATVLSAEQYVVFMGLVKSYFEAGYEYYAPESLKPEDQARLAGRHDR